MKEIGNPLLVSQKDVADTLRESEWFKENHVEVMEQDLQTVEFRRRRATNSLDHVIVIVGTDSLTNDFPALECGITLTCEEKVACNRAKQGFVTALDVVQAAIQIVDGELWHFFEMNHKEDEKLDKLTATATFKGLIDRSALFTESKED